jgi:hypothetical protein
MESAKRSSGLYTASIYEQLLSNAARSIHSTWSDSGGYSWLFGTRVACRRRKMGGRCIILLGEIAVVIDAAFSSPLPLNINTAPR